MALVRKSITVTDKQEQWIRSRIASGDYGNDSEYVRDLIRRDQERSTQLQDPGGGDPGRSGERRERCDGKGDLGGGGGRRSDHPRSCISAWSALHSLVKTLQGDDLDGIADGRPCERRL